MPNEPKEAKAAPIRFVRDDLDHIAMRVMKAAILTGCIDYYDLVRLGMDQGALKDWEDWETFVDNLESDVLPKFEDVFVSYQTEFKTAVAEFRTYWFNKLEDAKIECALDDGL